jgi:anthranilate phosphoribosyltransferase
MPHYFTLPRKNVGPIRKELAVKPFNMLTDGKSIFPKNQLVGVFNLELARIYSYLYQNTDVNVTILHSMVMMKYH